MSDVQTTTELRVDRRNGDRRVRIERREGAAAADYAGPERRKAPRRKVERRRQIDPTTCERDYTNDEIEFMKAMDQYKRDNRRPFPTWSEVLEVLHSLGYRRVAEPTALPGGKRERGESGVAQTPLPAKS